MLYGASSRGQDEAGYDFAWEVAFCTYGYAALGCEYFGVAHIKMLEWLRGRYVSCALDWEEFVAIREEILRDDLLKVRLSVRGD